MFDDNESQGGDGRSSILNRRDLLRGGLAVATSAALLLSPAGRAASGRRVPIVETTHGKLRGRVRHGLAEYKGIHYGASTGGANRFLGPQPVRAWSGVRDATRLGNQSPQSNDDMPMWLDPSPASEDCLVLNVWAPETAGRTSRLPVMVWLHGGGFRFGSAGAPGYDGGDIARAGNVVTVGINHRLNIFGYTYLGDSDERFAASGNAGQLDIVAALEWVRDNIEAFGGNPGNVTVFGQSGGGGKVTTLLAMESARGLFHKAIVQSGSLLRVHPPADAAELTHRIYADLGIRTGDVAALQRLPTAALLKSYVRLWESHALGANPGTRHGPVADGKVISDPFWQGAAPTVSRDIPMIIGSDLHETILFYGADVAKPIADDTALATAAAAYAVINQVDPAMLQPVIAGYRKAMPELSAQELVVRISTDLGFWKNAIRQCELKSAAGGAPVFAYECQWKTPCFGGQWAPHGVELPFVFNHRHYGAAWDGKDSDTLRAATDPRGDRFRVGDQMFRAWIAFARSGTPSTRELSWPAYDVAKRSTMVFDRSTRVVDDVRSDVRALVASI
jgi:para-nitrobenzyl esterase